MSRMDWIDLYRRTGVRAPGGEMIRVIQGRPYFNLSLISAMLQRLGLSPSRFIRSVGHGGDPAAAPGREDRPFRAFLLHPFLHFRLLWRQARTPQEALAFLDRVHTRTRRLKA